LFRHGLSRGNSLEEIGREFGIATYSSVSIVIDRTKAMIAKDRVFRHRVKELKEEINMSQEQTWPLFFLTGMNDEVNRAVAQRAKVGWLRRNSAVIPRSSRRAGACAACAAGSFIIQQHTQSSRAFGWAVVGYLAKQLANHPLKETAEQFKRDPVVISKGIKGLEKKIDEDKTIITAINMLRESLTKNRKK